MKIKATTRKSCYSLTLVVFIVLLIGCSPDVVYINRTNTTYINRTINQTIYITNTTIEPCNLTCPECSPCSEYDRDYVLGLIRQLKKYEKQQDKYMNHSDCFDNLNTTTNELEDCKHELCYEWNSSWC